VKRIHLIYIAMKEKNGDGMRTKELEANAVRVPGVEDIVQEISSRRKSTSAAVEVSYLKKNFDDDQVRDVEHSEIGNNTGFVDDEVQVPLQSEISCNIESHIIEKKRTTLSREVSTRAFDKLRRKLPDRTSYHVIFCIQVMDSEDTSCVKRSYNQFKSLHAQVFNNRFF